MRVAAGPRRSVHHTPHYIHWSSSLDRVSFYTHPLHSGPLPAWLRASPGSVGAAQPLRVGDPFPFPPAPQSRPGPGREGMATADQLPPWAFLSVLVSSLPSLNFQQFLKDMLPCSRRKEQEATQGGGILRRPPRQGRTRIRARGGSQVHPAPHPGAQGLNLAPGWRPHLELCLGPSLWLQSVWCQDS